MLTRSGKPVCPITKNNQSQGDFISLAQKIIKFPNDNEITGGVQFFLQSLISKKALNMKDTSLYEKNKNPDQESLVLNNLNLVKRIALHLKARLPSHVELDELMQVGMIGLIEASKSFKFDKGIQFENYAHARVRGSMIDEIRKMSSQPRSSLT